MSNFSVRFSSSFAEGAIFVAETKISQVGFIFDSLLKLLETTFELLDLHAQQEVLVLAHVTEV